MAKCLDCNAEGCKKCNYTGIVEPVEVVIFDNNLLSILSYFEEYPAQARLMMKAKVVGE